MSMSSSHDTRVSDTAANRQNATALKIDVLLFSVVQYVHCPLIFRWLLFLFFRCQLQILVQVLATVIEGGTVADTFPVVVLVRASSVRRPASSRSRKQSMRPYPSSNLRRLLHVGDGVQHKKSALPVTNPSVTAERKSMKPSNTMHTSAGDVLPP